MRRTTAYQVRIPIKHGGSLQMVFLQQPSCEHVIQAFRLEDKDEGGKTGAELAKRIRSWASYGNVRECPYTITPIEIISDLGDD